MDGQDSFLWGLKIADSLTMELSAQITVIALGVALICFICNLAYNYLYHGISQLITPDENKFPDYMEIARCLAIFFCLTLYSPIAKTVVGTMEVINQATALTNTQAQELSAYVGKATDDQTSMFGDYEKHSLEANVATGEDQEGAMDKELANKEQGNETSGIVAILQKILQLLNPANIVAMVLHALATLLVSLIEVVILGVGVVIFKILVILGPLAFAFNILPVFKKQLSVWFGTLCTVGMVFSVINILNRIMWFTFKSIYGGAFDVVNEATKQHQYLAMDLALVGAYCCCFWLAGKIVGHSDAGKIISKTVSILTAGAALGVFGTSAITGSSSTNVGAAAALGKSVITDEQ